MRQPVREPREGGREPRLAPTDAPPGPLPDARTLMLALPSMPGGSIRGTLAAAAPPAGLRVVLVPVDVVVELLLPVLRCSGYYELFSLMVDSNI